MADTSSILNRLLTALSVSDPTWDTTVGSATYKILESVAQEISNTSNNSTLLTYGYDVNSKFGTELDAFVNLFGITRQLGTRSVGAVTFSTGTPASQDFDIPLGTQIYSSSNQYQNNIAFTTTSTATLASGNVAIIVPAISTLPGSFNNLGAGSINSITTPLVGISTVTNENSMSYGFDTETDVQLQQRFLNTAFSNFAGTANKFLSLAQNNPAITQSTVLGAQQNYVETLQVVTVLSGTNKFNLGLQTQAQLIAISGTTVASGYVGLLETNVAVPISSTSPTNIIAPDTTVSFDGTNYNLSSTASGNGTLNIAYTYSGSAPVTLSGQSSYAHVATAISGLLNSVALNYSNTVAVTVTGTSTSVSGVAQITFNQNIPWNVVVTSGVTVSAINTITSQIPDSKYCYPAGNELVGVNFNNPVSVASNFNQPLFTRGVDYNYIQASGTPPLALQITFNPAAGNAPYTYTGANIQLQSSYIPISSRVTTSGTTILNPNFVDIFINSTNTQSVTEQVVMITGNIIALSGSNGYLSASNFVLANNTIVPSGGYYINSSQDPLANFPYQVINNNAPSFISFGNYNFPIALLPQRTSTPITVTGTAGSNQLYTSTSISGLQVGLVISGTNGNTTSLSGIGTGNYITALTAGNPNIITLANNLSSNVGVDSAWVAVMWPAYDITSNAGSMLDLSGTVLEATDPTGSYGASYPSATPNQVGIFTHDYYSDVVNIDNLAQQSRVVGSNVLVHQANFVNLIVNLSIVYTSTANFSATNSAIQSAITNYFQNVPFDSSVSFSTILNSAFNATGVQSVRISTAADNPTNYGVQVVNLDGSIRKIYTKDILLSANQIPNLYSINYTVFGVNNF